MRSTILIADDHKIFRDGLRSLLEQQHDLHVVAEAEDGRTAVELALKLSPDVAIVDVGMPGLNGIEATRRIVGEVPHVKVIALSMHSDSKYVGSMLKAGATGYVLKDCAFEELESAIHAVLANRAYLSKDITGVVVDNYVRQLSAAEVTRPVVLTPKEREVLQLLAEGRTTKQIAMQLHVSVKTIETHRKHIMDRLDLHSVAELTKYAIREGITSLDD
ncbi:MAG: response regulator [Planctomycetota bacterium]|jgi:DNA-binding NarL/FixJ family response regulator